MLKITNRALQDIATIHGQLISGNISIDSTSNTRRSGSVSLIVAHSDVDKICQINATNFIRIYWGVQSNTSLDLLWYRQGTFVISQNNFNFDPRTRNLSLTLTDRMADLSGERKGVLHAYSTIVKNSQRVDDVMKNALALGGVTDYDIIPICPLKTTSDVEAEQTPEDLMVPFDFKFGEGVTIYEILEKCVTLYPYYEMFFDVDGKFICQKKVLDGDNSLAVLDDSILRPMALSEDTTFTVFDIKNIVEIWGKGGNYYGEVRDERPNSPFTVSAIGEFRKVESFDQIYDRYRDTDKATELQKKQSELQNIIGDLEQKDVLTAEETRQLADAKNNLSINKNLQAANISIYGNDMADQWAHQILEECCRTNQSITIHCVGLPCINDAGFKIYHRSKTDDIPYVYIVQSVNHDLSNNTTDLVATRFYSGQSASIKTQLPMTGVTQSIVTGMTLSITVSNVEGAETYNLYIDGSKVAESNTSSIEFTVPDYLAGTHEVTVSVGAEGYVNSKRTQSITVDFEDDNILITDDNEAIITDVYDTIIID